VAVDPVRSPAGPGRLDLAAAVAEVAAAVALAEGGSGVRDVLREIARSEPVPVRELSRAVEIPVPVVAAVCNELRRRGVVERSQPVRLTGPGREAVGPVRTVPDWTGASWAVPAELTGLAGELAELAAAAPAAKVELDQTHCTVATKVRRVLALDDAGALAGKRLLLLGDDDLTSLALGGYAAAVGAGTAGLAGLTVLDVDPDLLDFIADRAAAGGLPVTAVRYDARQPLPEPLRGEFDIVCTDPPYTVAGAELFLSRAVSALRPGVGGHVFFSFGARRPDETVATQRLIAEMGLAVRALLPNFNSYLGAGILAGTSHLYHLRSTAAARPAVTGPHTGHLYTADGRVAVSRPYRCAGCRAVHPVGPGGRWPRIADLQAAGCPDCAGTVFRPLARGPRPAGTAGAP
jgi:predicted methyltransferase